MEVPRHLARFFLRRLFLVLENFVFNVLVVVVYLRVLFSAFLLYRVDFLFDVYLSLVDDSLV